MMTIQNWRPTQYGAGVLILFNNAMYGTIRMHQSASTPAEHGTRLTNPDFAARTIVRCFRRRRHHRQLGTARRRPAAFIRESTRRR
jgi:hypothetical protein